MSKQRVSQSFLLPELKLIKVVPDKEHGKIFVCEKQSAFEVCPKCATKSSTIYDHVEVMIRDAPIRISRVKLKIRKRRFLCKPCKKPFREPVPGVIKGFRTTQRFRSHIRWAASNFGNLKSVAKHVKCSNWLVYTAYYEQIELELRKVKNPWPKTIGIDEHSFVRNVKGPGRDFVTVFVDYDNKRIREVVFGKSLGDLHGDRIKSIVGRENVRNVILDLSPTFRSFAESFFPNARLIADKFHVVKLIHGLINEKKREVVRRLELNGSRKNPITRLLRTYRAKLEYYQRSALDKFLNLDQELKEIYWFEQRLYRFYRIRGYNKAREILIRILDNMGHSKIRGIQSLRSTLRKWFNPILNYFSTNLTNGRTEGFNRKAKLIQRCAYGFRSFENYRLKLLYLCR